MAKLQELTIGASLGTSQDGSIAHASLSPQGLQIVVAKGESIKVIRLDSHEQVRALFKILVMHGYAQI